MLSLAKRLITYLKGFIVEALGVIFSREKQKQLLGISLYRNAFYLIIAHLALPLSGFLFWIIASRFYTPENVGLASATIAAMTLVAALSTLGLDYGLIRFLTHAGSNANRMVNSCLIITSLVSIMICGIFFAGISVWSPKLLFLRQNTIYLTVFVVFTIATTLSFLVSNAFVAQRRAGFVLATGLIFGLLRLPLPVLLVIFFHSFGIFASWGVSVVIALIISVLFFLPRAQPGYRLFPALSRSVVNEMIRFSSTNYIANLFWYVPGLILPIMVLHMLGAELNAYFYIAWSVGNLLAMIPQATSTSLFAEGSYDEQRLGADTKRSLKLTFLIIVPAAILILIIADKLLLLFGASYSEEGTMLLRILVLAAFPITINYIYLSVKRVENKLAVLIGLSAFIAIAALALSYLLLPRMGVNGVGIAWLGSQGVVAVGIVISFLVRRPAIREKMHWFRVSLWGRR